jgi:hypothetical protein
MAASSSIVRVERHRDGSVQLAAAARARRARQRHRNGRAVVIVEIDIEPVTAYLADAGLLRLNQVEDRQAIGIAIRDLLDLLLNMSRRHA